MSRHSTLRFCEIRITLFKTPEPAEIIATRFFELGSPAPVHSRLPQSYPVRREIGLKLEASVISALVTYVCEERPSSRNSRRFQDFAPFYFWQQSHPTRLQDRSRPFLVHTATVVTLNPLLAYVTSFLQSRSSTTSASFSFSVLSPIQSRRRAPVPRLHGLFARRARVSRWRYG